MKLYMQVPLRGTLAEPFSITIEQQITVTFTTLLGPKGESEYETSYGYGLPCVGLTSPTLGTDSPEVG